MSANSRTPHSHAMARPLKMFQPAIELEAVGSTDQVGEAAKSSEANPIGLNNQATAPPALLVSPDNRHTVVNYWGPERIETGWWRGPTTRRDYWRVETDTHQQFWIYKDLRRQKWFLQGAF